MASLRSLVTFIGDNRGNRQTGPIESETGDVTAQVSKGSHALRFASIAPHGLWLPLALMAVCTLYPALGECALDGLWLSTFCLVFFGVLCMAYGKVSRTEAGMAMAMVAAVAVAAPMFAYGAAALLQVKPELQALLVLAACSPIGLSVGALASIMGLPDRSAAFAALTSAILAPIVLPLAVHLLANDALPVSTHTLLIRAAVLVMVPAVAATRLRLLYPVQLSAWRADFRGLVILSLSVNAAARGPGLRSALAMPNLALYLALLGCLITGGALLAGWLLTRPFGRNEGVAGSFTAGMRSVPSAWAAVGNQLSPEGTMFMSLTVIPFYVVPMIFKSVIRWTVRSGAGSH